MTAAIKTHAVSHDLELPNFDRKVIERLMCMVLGEAAMSSLSQAQCACLPGRDPAMHVLQFSHE